MAKQRGRLMDGFRRTLVRRGGTGKGGGTVLRLLGTREKGDRRGREGGRMLSWGWESKRLVPGRTRLKEPMGLLATATWVWRVASDVVSAARSRSEDGLATWED